MLVLLSPVLLSIFTLILIFDGPPLLFIHKRVGKNGKEFVTYKFKTYRPIQAKNDYIRVDHKRAEKEVSPLGRMLRDHGWDELPQLVNILLGQMAFIGPRPLVDFTYEDMKTRYPNKVKEIEFWKKKRLEFLPGLSGWHQIHINDPYIIRYEMEYFKNPSMDKKIKIILDSITILLLGKSRYFKEKIPTSNQYEI